MGNGGKPAGGRRSGDGKREGVIFRETEEVEEAAATATISARKREEQVVAADVVAIRCWVKS